MSKQSLLDNRLITLSNGQVISPESIEEQVEKICHYVKFVFVGIDNSGKPFALIFPNQKLYADPDYERTPELGCFCPRNLDEIGRCLSGCLRQVKFNDHSGLESALIINVNLPEGITREEVYKLYQNVIDAKRDVNIPAGQEYYWVNLN